MYFSKQGLARIIIYPVSVFIQVSHAPETLTLNLHRQVFGGLFFGDEAGVLNKKTKKTKLRKPGDSKPGDWIGQVGSAWHYSVKKCAFSNGNFQVFESHLNLGNASPSRKTQYSAVNTAAV